MYRYSMMSHAAMFVHALIFYKAGFRQYTLGKSKPDYQKKSSRGFIPS
jgi:hypothetical protein